MAKKGKPARRKGSVPEHPTCNCALLCDDVLESKGRGKHNLIGIIGAILTPQFPAVLGGYVAYVRLSNVYGRQKVTIGLDDTASDEKVFEGGIDLPDIKDPLGGYTLVPPIPGFRIERPGRYMFSVKSGGIPLAESAILIQGPPEVKGEKP